MTARATVMYRSRAAALVAGLSLGPESAWTRMPDCYSPAEETAKAILHIAREAP